MKNKLNAEEQLLQDKLNQAEAGFNYQESSWQEMQQLLPKKGPLGKYGTLLKAGFGLILLAATAYVINGNWTNSSQNIIENQEIIANSENTKKIEKSTTTSRAIDDADEKSENSKVLTKSEESNVQSAEPKENSSESSINSQNTPHEILENNEPQLTQKQASESNSDVVNPKSPNYKLGQIKILGKHCIGSSISAEVNQKAEDQNIQLKWLIDGENLAINSTNANIQITRAGLLKIKVLALKDGVTIDSQETELIIEKNQDIDFTYHDLETPYNDLTVEFTAKPEGLTNFSWEVEGSRSDLNGEKTNYSFDRTGVFDVSLSHKSKMGCISEITKPVAVEINFDPLAPDAFTPDGNDLNEAFIPVGFTPEAGVITDDQFRMSIYDYNGKLVFTTRSNTEPWNGRLNNQGNVLAEGAYVWKVEIKNKEGKQARFAGKVRIR